MLIASFLFFLAVFVSVGVLATRGRKHSDEDYLIAGRDTPPIMTALSAQASSNSGFMFIGLIAAVYVGGLHMMWLVIGFLVGDLLMSFFVYPQFNRESVARNAITFPDLLARWGGNDFHYVRLLAAILTVVLLAIYCRRTIAGRGQGFRGDAGLGYSIWCSDRQRDRAVLLFGGRPARIDLDRYRTSGCDVFVDADADDLCDR